MIYQQWSTISNGVPSFVGMELLSKASSIEWVGEVVSSPSYEQWDSTPPTYFWAPYSYVDSGINIEYNEFLDTHCH